MIPELQYPFDGDYILAHKKKLKKQLLSTCPGGVSHDFIPKKIAVLGGSTTHDICLILELFLLNDGILPEFYESEYNQYYQDAMFPNPVLEEFSPDLIYIHTTNRNITQYPEVNMTAEEIDALLEAETERFAGMWGRLAEVYRCPVIQNNFEYPDHRILGNLDAADIHGAVNFVTRLNQKFYEYAQTHEKFYIHDINYISSCYGLDRWSDPFYWHMYKYACAVPAIPTLAFNLARIVRAIFGKNKKGFVTDLDNTLWGGVVGDDGVEGLEIGQETSMGQAYAEFQSYLKKLKGLGLILNVDSKNDEENALAGLNHPSGVLRPEDFIIVKANWEPKDRNFAAIAEELNLLPESLVFLDDNPAERAIVCGQLPGVCAPPLDRVENYIRLIDRGGYFETISLSADDRKRNAMYRENAERKKLQASFASYEEYLLSLEMTAQIRPFEPVYMARIAQLTNKSNQFNLTTRRCTQDEIERMAQSPEYITLYGKLEDRFGDNGVVTVAAGRIHGDELDMILWLMSCRVLKRDMEYAMMDVLVSRARTAGVRQINGFYCPTAKNGMVKDFYALQGFEKVREAEDGSTAWKLSVDDYEPRNHVIRVRED
ncbi:MAG: HAD-IIIC family phosphatase [Lachnospiraceae bacterium]|nr:HAD-IIIC family phosphatase [Lachnospiraceae bacterium]